MNKDKIKDLVYELESLRNETDNHTGDVLNVRQLVEDIEADSHRIMLCINEILDKLSKELT